MNFSQAMHLWLLVFSLGTLINFDGAFSVSRSAPDIETRSGGFDPQSIASLVESLKKLDQSGWIAKDNEVIVILGDKGVDKSIVATLLSNPSHVNAVSDAGGKFVYKDDRNDTSSLLPRLVRSTSGAAIYDFPEFDDAAGLESDLSVTYCLRRLLNYASKIKFVFVIDYDSVKQAAKREKFLKLARRGVSIVKDVANYVRSMPLVVTKVENSLTDNQTRMRILDDFLRPVRKDIQSQNKDKLIVSFLEIYEAVDFIGLLRQPDKAGLVQDIPLVQSAIKNLDELVNNKTSYAEKSAGGFGDVLAADASKNAINYYFDQTLSNNLNQLSGEIVNFYTQKEAEIVDLFRINKVLEFGLGNLSKLEFTHPKEFSEHIVDTLNILEISVPSDLLQKLTHNDVLNTLYEISGYTIKPESLSGLKSAKDFLQNSAKWYKTLLDKYDFLSGNEMQLRIANDRYSLDSLKQDIFKNFDRKTVADRQLKSLERVWDQVKSYTVTEICDSSRFRLSGKTVRVSDALSNSCFWSATSIELVAWDTLIIDKDIDKSGEEASLTLIAPTWEIVNDVKINLDGRHAQQLKKKAADKGTRETLHGQDGEAGKAGGSAGHFLGIGTRFSNHGQVTITANGGNGADGQSGGDGFRGKNVDMPPLLNNQWSGAAELEQYSSARGISYKSKGRVSVSGGWRYEWEVVMTEGFEKPGNGGDGGKAGAGGLPGNVTIVTFLENPDFVVFSQPGTPGTSGKGGFGGNKVESKRRYNYYITYRGRHEDIIYNAAEHEALEWLEAKDGKNAAMAPSPSAEVPLRSISPVIGYKNFTRENLANNVIESVVRDFVRQIDNCRFIGSLYGPLEFADEFLSLESQFLALRDQISFIPFFESLDRRIADFEKSRSPVDDEKRMVDYVRSAIYSKMCVLNENANQNVVVNLPEYLKSLQKKIGELMGTDDKVSINNNANEFKQSIEKKIQSAELLISNEVLPEIDKLAAQMTKDVENLLSENIKLQNQATVEVDKQAKVKMQLEKSLKMRKALEPVRIFSSLIAFTGPQGAAAGAVLGGVHSLANSLIDDPKLEASKVQLSARFADSVQKIKVAYKAKQELLKKQLETSEEVVKKSLLSVPGKYVKGLHDKIKDVQNKLLTQKFSSVGVLTSYFKQEFVSYVEDNQKMMKQDIKDVKEYAKTAHVFKQVGMVMAIYDVSVSEFEQIKSDERAIESVADTIEKTKSDLSALQQHEEVVRQFMISSVGGLKETLASLNFSSKPVLETELSVWRIQNALKDIKVEFHKLTSDFEDARVEFGTSVDKIESGLTFLADVYDRIDSYYDRQQLAQYMANINYGAASFARPEYNTKADELKLIMKSNFLLERFEVALNAFKQHYFPFAHKFLNVYQFPSDIELKDPPKVKGKVMDIINRMVEQSKDSENTIESYEKYQFTSREFEFFAWDSRLIKNESEKLLKGQKVVLNADIVKGVNLDAVRFKNMSIEFEFKDQQTQLKFEEEFKNYEVNMTMVGNNYYRCGSRFYYISGSSDISIAYSVKKDARGEPNERNSVYEKIYQNAFFLSPYTLWEIDVQHVNDAETLAKYIGKDFKLKLTGAAQYLKRFPVEFCNRNVSNYYSADTTLTVV